MRITPREMSLARVARKDAYVRSYRQKSIDDVLWRITLLKEAMSASGMNQAQVAHMLGITQVQVCRWMKGERSIPDRWLVDLADLVDKTH